MTALHRNRLISMDVSSYSFKTIELELFITRTPYTTNSFWEDSKMSYLIYRDTIYFIDDEWREYKKVQGETKYVD